MTHKPIILEKISFELPQKTCFANFSTHILPAARIAVIGRNGSGKSSLLKMLLQEIEPSSGQIKNLNTVTISAVPQTVLTNANLSGGERFNKAFSEALAQKPDILILDEPTNHLDQTTRATLMHMLNAFQGTLIMATHDTHLINTCATTLWHIENEKITVFSGNYADYINEQLLERLGREKNLNNLKKERHKIKELKQLEQTTMAQKGKGTPKDNDKKFFKRNVNFGQKEAANRIRKMRDKIEDIQQQISDNRLPEILLPKFALTHTAAALSRNMLSVVQGACGYENITVLKDISFSMTGTDKVALLGDNGSGKTTFLRALRGQETVWRKGDWSLPKSCEIGYVDQHYGSLNPDKTVEEIIHEANPALSRAEVRKHLNDYLFRKNEEVFAQVRTLSGGEKAKLSLAQVAANPPKLLILDEITNNLDIETKDYITTVLQAYPGAYILISHEPDFLDALPLTARYRLQNGQFNHLSD